MKAFDPVSLDPALCRTHVDELAALLAGKPELGERADVLPFFRDRPQLLALLATFFPDIGTADQYAHEYDLFGDFTADFAVGNRAAGAYCLIEFEDATADSVFSRQGNKFTREWGRRFERGFSQVVDWCFKLDGLIGSREFMARFGVREPLLVDLVLVIGRDQFFEAGEQDRFNWRTKHVLVKSNKVHCMTFDQLHRRLASRLPVFAAGAAAPDPTRPAAAE